VIAGAILAAGRGERLGGDVPKPLREVGGRALVDHALDTVRASGLQPVLLVVGYAADDVAAHAPPDVTVLRNPHWEEGIASSLRTVVAALLPRAEVDAVVIGPADQPLVGPEAFRRVAASYDAGASLAVATYAGVRANPVLVGRSRWDEALQLTGDEGARRLMDRDVVEVACDGTGSPDDVDTPDDLAAMEERWRSRTPFE
jgi:molybdenum cofactor cytidylyltransferase